MKSVPALKYLLSLSPVPLVIAGNLLGGPFSLMNAFYGLAIMTFSEQFFQEDKKENQFSSVLPNLVLIAHGIFQSVCLLSLFYGIHSGLLNGIWIIAASVSTGLNSALAGLTSAHEMIHRKEKMFRLIGIWNLVTVNYGHFYIEHIKGHHKLVGTKKDPATAYYGESVYHFVARTIPNQFISAIKIEAGRLRKQSALQYSLSNFVVKILLTEIILSVTLLYFFGLKILFAFLLQSFIAILILEYVNYIEHYGLVRDENERVNATHSWQSDHLLSRFALIELSRHADHHYYASKPYHTLKSYEESPMLPSGYFGSFYTALIPSLWFKKINPLIDAMKVSS